MSSATGSRPSMDQSADRPGLASLQRSLAWLLVAGVAIQHYLAGLAAFGAASFDAHALTGYVLILIAVALTVLAGVARARRRVLRQCGVLAILALLQPVLALVPRVDAPALSAVHVVNGLLLFLVSLRVARAAAD